MKHFEELDRPPAGWHPVTVMRKTSRKWDWVALMVDVDPDDLKHCTLEGNGLALLFINPDECTTQKPPDPNDIAPRFLGGFFFGTNRSQGS